VEINNRYVQGQDGGGVAVVEISQLGFTLDQVHVLCELKTKHRHYLDVGSCLPYAILNINIWSVGMSKDHAQIK